MNCEHCGSEIKKGSAYCDNCGAKQPDSLPTESVSFSQNNTGSSESPKHVGFVEAVSLYFKNYVNFNGRSTRSEYWWVILFTFLLGLVAGIVSLLIPPFSKLVSLAIFLPSLSLGVRRLHDIGKSWVWLLLGLIPLVGSIILIVLFCQPSDNDNQWGVSADNK